MKKPFFKRLSSLTLLCMISINTLASGVQGESYLIKSVAVYNPQKSEFSLPKDVLVRDGRISQIGKVRTTDAVTTIDGTGRYLLPGFTEMHAHVRPSKVSAEERDRFLFLFYAHGVTTIRGMLGHPLHLQMREKLATNLLPGPRLITSGPSFNGNSVISAEQASGRTQAQFERGYDFIKVHPGMTDAEFRAMAERANQLGFDYSGHITAETGILESIKLGQGTIEHLDGVMEELYKRTGKEDQPHPGFFGFSLVNSIDDKYIVPLAKELAASGIKMVPTQSMMWGFLSPEDPKITAAEPRFKLMTRSNMDNWSSTRRSIHKSPDYSKENVARFTAIRKTFLQAYVAAGGAILLGSDAPQMFNVPGDSLHDEMEWMADIGMTPAQVLNSTTLETAKFFDRESEFGSVEVGKAADLVLLTENPLDNIQNTRQIAGVMARGIWLSKAEIDARLAMIRQQK